MRTQEYRAATHGQLRVLILALNALLTAHPHGAAGQGAEALPPESQVREGDVPAVRNPAAWPPIGLLDSPRLSESSGIAKSTKYPGIFWTHNDSGGPPVLFAVKLSGEVVAEIPIAGARAVDWEDITIDDQNRIYIADIGDNKKGRDSYEIYEVPEPDPQVRPIVTAQVSRVLRYRLPKGPTNCEAVFWYEGRLYVITKQREKKVSGAGLYRLDPGSDGALTPARVGTVPLWPVTAAEVSGDRKRLAVCSYGRLAVFDIPGDWSQLDQARTKWFFFPPDLQTEACCFDGEDVILTAESRQVWRVTAAEFEQKPVSPP